MASSGMNILFSDFDLKSKVTIPSLTDELLAYETGVHIGDGSLQIVEGGTHSVRYFGHSEDDWIFYSKLFPAILEKLYNKKVRPTKRTDARTCTLSLCSKAIATFKRDFVGLPVGNKNKMTGLPEVVKANDKLLMSCIRGIADTDFSLFFYKKGGKYSHPAISCVLSNKYVVQDIEEALNYLGFTTSTRYDVKRLRNDKAHVEHVVTVCGKDQLRKWNETIGFYNPKHATKFEVWDTLGYCQPRQSTQDRLALISSF